MGSSDLGRLGEVGWACWEVAKLQFAQGIGFRVFADVFPSFYLKPLYGVQWVSIYSSIYLSIHLSIMFNDERSTLMS